MRRLLPLAAFALCWTGQALAEEFFADGLLDLRLAETSVNKSGSQGGWGTLRYGGSGSDQSTRAELGQISVMGGTQLTKDILLYAQAKYDPAQKTAFDLVEAYARYRPVSLSRWRWSVKGGAFFPPISLENTAVGWTSPWTLTPSAINSWVGEELRTIGGEGKLEWRGDQDLLEITGALFWDNDTAGTALAERGWVLTDRVVGLLDRLRLPDELGREYHQLPLFTDPFLEIDGRPGWYGGLSWQRPDIGTVSLLRYDNQADPSSFRRQFAWRTSFWSLGGVTDWDEFEIISQLMAGSTEIDPSPDDHSVTDFQAGYLLAGYAFDDWRLALRGELFATQTRDSGVDAHAGEHGHAVTLAVTYRPMEHLRITAEAIRSMAWRGERSEFNLPAGTADTLLQLGVRVFF